MSDPRSPSPPGGPNKATPPRADTPKTPERPRPPMQEEHSPRNQQLGAESPSYSDMAAKTMANIQRLQENVGAAGGSAVGGAAAAAPPSSVERGVSSVWVGNCQGPSVSTSDCGGISSSPSSHVQQIQVNALTSPKRNATRPLLVNATPPESPLPCISPTLATTFNALVTIDPNWQASKKTLRERNAVMCGNTLLADIYFNVGAGLEGAGPPRKFPAHKYILSTGSSVFYAMFHGGLDLDAKESVIEVPDVDPGAFSNLLR